MDSRRNSSEGAAEKDHHPSSPAPASSSHDVQSSAGSSLSGLRLLSAAAVSSGSGTPDHDPASMALCSCEHSCLQRAHTISRRHEAELHLQIESAGTTAQAFSQFCQDQHDRLQHRLERANELLALRDADVANMEEKIAHTEDRLQEQKRQRVEAEDLVGRLRHQVNDLESQIAALSSHPDLGSAPPPALSRRLVARDRELHDLNVAHSALQQRCLALEQSEEALSEAASQLRRQADALKRRVARLREERGSLQDSLRDAQLRRQRAEEMRQMESERVIKRRAELQAQGKLAAQQTIAGHSQDREAIIQDRDSIARDRDSLMQDRDDLAQDHEVIVSDYLRLQEQYSNATASRVHKSQHTDAASSAPRDVLDLRTRSPVRKNYPSSDSAQIDDSMSSASDDGNRNTADAAAEIDRPPESSKGPDTSPSSDSELQEVEPEIALQNVSDTTPPEIAGSDKREAVEEKVETEDDGTDDEALSALSRSRSSLRHRGSLTPGHRALQPIIDVDGDGDSPSGSSSGNSGNEGSDLAGATLEVDEIDYSPLFPTFVPRRLWIPGVCARLFRQPDIILWDVYAVSSLRVSENDVQTLSALLTSVSERLFPAIDPASHPHPDSYEDLITGATVDALMDTSPWSKLSNG
ncbi:unnamed protein product [Phytophthora fragariaefolia]|uniref:Unnamed protein product n=1 Tax=Phytophthora fragariaefolia TaxID=1490495 RepID=A0A9W6Y130_9STRA|nr:unnamed protein product [Phytophthora fragariaefolia]